jgi:hypothetical protein
MLEIEFLGTGTSTGVPSIKGDSPVCFSTDAHDKRLRCSAVVRYQGVNILLDCGPDFRQQIMRATSRELDALLITHIHYDHVGGIDDLRPYAYEQEFPIYASKDVIEQLHHSLPYAFAEHLYPGVPRLKFKEIDRDPFKVAHVEVEPIPVWHGKYLIRGYRIGPLAYITDCKTIDDEQVERIKHIPLLVVNALHRRDHHSHMNLEQALALVEKVQPGRTFFIHMSEYMGFHEEVNAQLPPNVRLAYDTQVVHVAD